MPELYPWVRAAKYLNMSVVALIEREDGEWLRDMALSVENAEIGAHNDAARRQQQRQQRQGRR